MDRAGGRAPVRRRRLAVASLLAVGVALAAALAYDLLVAPTPPPAAEAAARETADAGSWYCPVTAADGETAVLSLAAVGDLATQATVVRYGEHGPAVEATVEVDPGDQSELVLDGGRAGDPLAVSWEQGPAVVSWRVDGPDSAAAPCEPAPQATWHVSGFDTTLGNRATLHLFNPFAQDALARVVFATPEGEVALVRTDGVLVDAGSSLAVDLVDLQPEQPDLGVVVEVLAGRLVAQGEVVFAPPGEDPQAEATEPVGRTLLPAAAQPSLAAGFGFARADEGASSWLSVLNPGQREAAVQVSVSDPRADAPVLLDETSVPARGVLRIDLAGASTQPEFAVATSSLNEVPVVVTRVTAVRTDAGRQGVAASRAGPAARVSALVGGGSAGRAGRVSVYNPGAAPANVRIDTAGGVWDGIEVPANGRAIVALGDADPTRAAIAARVTADVGVVAELRSLSSGEHLQLWTAVGVPESAWAGSSARPPVRHEPGLAAAP